MERGDAALAAVLVVAFLVLARRGGGPDGAAPSPLAPDSIAVRALFQDLTDMREGESFTVETGSGDRYILRCSGVERRGADEVRLLDTEDRRFAVGRDGAVYSVHELAAGGAMVPLFERGEGGEEADEVDSAVLLLAHLSPPYLVGLRSGACLAGAAIEPGTYPTDLPAEGATVSIERSGGRLVARFGNATTMALDPSLPIAREFTDLESGQTRLYEWTLIDAGRVLGCGSGE